MAAMALHQCTNALGRLQALQALAVVLRGAHDDCHPCAAQCRPGRVKAWVVTGGGKGRN